jgi:hypothetical protein
MVDIPDFGTPLRRIAGSVDKIAGVPPDDEAAEISGESSPHAAPPGPSKADSAKSEVQSHA